MAQAVPVRLQRRVARIAWPAIAVTATLICGAFASGAAHPNDLVAAAGDLAVAVVFVTCGAILWADDRTGDLSGPLMVATGAAWLLGDLADGLALLHRGPLVQLLVAAPGGRPRTWTERLVVAAGYADALVAGVWHNEGATVGLAVAVAVTAIGRWVRAGVAQRHARAVPAAAAVTITLVLVAGALAGAQHGDAVMWCYEAVLVLTAVALFVDARRRLVPQVVTKVVIDLGSTAGGSLTQALRRAVGDPSLVVGYVLDDGRVVDEAGRHVDLPTADAERSVTTIEADGTSAVLVHDRTALRARGLADSVAAAVRLALENARLESEIRARLRDVEASRARLVATRDSERRSLERRLRAGVDDRLGCVARLLEGLERDPEPLISALPSELGRARGALARFAAGLHPAGLEAGGLPVALGALAAGAPQRVEVDVACGRLAPDVELAAWFVCSEALANAIKHAAAAQVTIRAELADGWLGLTVADDGPGGADPAAGRGLRGLAARVEVIGGRLELGERPGGGTRLRAWLPAREGT